MNDLVVIVIPVYKKVLTDLERISLMQVKRILGGYPIAFVAADSFVVNYGAEFNSFPVERFSDAFFLNTSTYSQLLLSKHFYERFSKYKFLLVYQLDAFVFSDKLTHFCNMNYDYIGAPMGYVRKKVEWNGWIGNGGFSLRKIESIICLLEKMKEFRKANKALNNEWEILEDQFFAFCGREHIEGFSVAPVETALTFSFDSDAKRCYRRNQKKLPFGCHAWSKNDITFYKKRIEAFGYKIPQRFEENGNADYERHIKTVDQYLCGKFYRMIDYHQNMKRKLERIFGQGNTYAVFGAGKDGVRCYHLLEKEDIPVYCFFDNDKKKQNMALIEGKPVYSFPDLIWIRERKLKILVATRYFQEGIIAELLKKGFIWKKDFV